MFIVVEGLDGVGKTTQCRLLSEKLSAVMYSFPNRRGIIWEIIENYLNKKIELTDQSIHLLFSVDRWEMKNAIISDLENDKIVIADRYIPSGLAYSLANDLDYEWCEKSDSGLPMPDLVIFLKSGSMKIGEDKYENVAFQEKVEQCYKKIALSEKYRNIWKEINVDDKTENVINDEILNLLREKIFI
jgi:dTMP kinase